MNTTRRALITGASSGIGAVYADRLAQTGHDLVIVARRKDHLDELAARLATDYGVQVEVMVADLAQRPDVRRVALRLEALPAIDVFINNAGYAARGPVASLDADALDEMLEVNVMAMSRLASHAMAAMTRTGHGIIINISSITSFLLRPGNAGYGASKSFVMAFSRHMQLEAEGTGVYVQLLVPGVVATDFHRIAGADLSAFPPSRVMSAEDLVTASLCAVEAGELVCIPSLPETAAWELYCTAEAAIAADASHDRIASRYRCPVNSKAGL
ncbi:short-subunit dehydrogenase [Luteibacter sp. 621]|uniref:SDR family NAD(P)-dependent oxidoreductase n=1 Tax=Luteibacter sp. 621 TaxID=3373916 RepID=UPI003D1E92F2